MTPEPTDQDRRNATYRKAVADKEAAEYCEAVWLAIDALGAGYRPWMKLVLIDADHRQTGDTTPVATVFKVFTGEKRLSENSKFIRRMPDGTVMVADRYEALFGELLDEKHPTRTVEVRGERVPVGKYELCWSALDNEYAPKTAEELAKLRASREQKKAERAEAKDRAENPLFTSWAEKNQDNGHSGP